jgi:hypothetical protein
MSQTDRELDAAWRVASREEPAAALDAAIRAAARRAVDAGPARARHARWWPLAAAAAVAVIAVGIMQVTPPEQVTPTIVADSTPLAGATKKDLDKPAAPAPPATVAPARSVAEPAADAVSAERAANVLRKQLAQAPAVTQPVAGGALEEKEKRAAAPSGTESANIGAQFAAAPERDRALKSKVEMAAAPAESAAPVARSEPFPASPSAARSATNAPAPAAPPAAVAAAKPMAATSAGALAARADEGQSSGPRALDKVAADGERAKDAAPRPADEWIKLIRRLKSEGRNEEAVKELAAFRAAYKDRSDALLPADLREAK